MTNCFHEIDCLLRHLTSVIVFELVRSCEQMNVIISMLIVTVSIANNIGTGPS
jgi:hypothetical protein